MAKRLISSLLLGVVVVLASAYYPVCGFVTTFLIVAGLYEFFYMVEKKGVKLFKLFGILVGALIPITIYFHFSIKEGWQFFCVIGLFVLFMLELQRRKAIRQYYRFQPRFSASSIFPGF
jgi:CDP-diglyceride synthetase